MPWDIQVDILSRLSTKNLHNLEGVCKDWQSIIKSPRFHMLQINANPNQDGLLVYSFQYQGKCHIQPLDSNEIYKFDIPIQYPHCKTTLIPLYEILAVSNGLVLVKLRINWELVQFLVYNPITKQCIELPELSIISLFFLEVCDFFEHDLQSSSYKIFLASLHGIYIYSSSSHKWQVVDLFSNFKLNLKFNRVSSLRYPVSCIMYKNNIYIAFTTTEFEWMMVVYNPKNDAWSNLRLGIQQVDYSKIGARLIIADDRLFFVHTCYYLSIKGTIISIFEIKIEDRLFIPITKITC